MATSPQSSEGFSRELVLRQDLPPRGGIAYLEPLQPLAPPEEDSGGLPALWQMVRGHRVAIALVAIAGAAAGLCDARRAAVDAR